MTVYMPCASHDAYIAAEGRDVSGYQDDDDDKKKPKKPKQKLIPGAGGAAKSGGKGNIHLGRWFEEEDAKPKAKAVRKVPSFGSKPKGGKK